MSIVAEKEEGKVDLCVISIEVVRESKAFYFCSQRKHEQTK